MGEKRGPFKNLWYYGMIYLGLIGFWWLATAGWFGFENWRSDYRFALMMINKTGLVAMLFAGRHLFFPGNRWPQLFGWTLGSAVLALIAVKIWINPDFSLDLSQLAELGDGFIWCLFGAWLLELVGAIYLEWLWAPIEASTLIHFKERLGASLLKLGLFSSGIICFLELYGLNVFPVEMISVEYLLLIPFIGVGIGLYGIFGLRMNHWIKERIGVVDDQLLRWMDGKVEGGQELLSGLSTWEMNQVQVLLLWRRYLEDLKKPGLGWWVLGEYLVLSGLIISLPYWMKVVMEV